MASKISDRVPIRVLPVCQEADAPAPRELTGCRFMGVLLHPVPWTEMQRRFNVSHRGCRLVVHWPAEACGDHPVQAGDVLQVDGTDHTVYGVVERPGCYLEIYLDAP
jgi:hypothetical protein